MLISAINDLREKLLLYWDEIVPSDIIDMLYNIKNNSDIRFVESWIGSFENFVEKGHATLDMSFDEMKQYAASLEFDEANHEINAPYVKAWIARHEN